MRYFVARFWDQWDIGTFPCCLDGGFFVSSVEVYDNVSPYSWSSFVLPGFRQ